MKATEFCYWLQGYFELVSAAPGAINLSVEQVACVRAHLALVFQHDIDPSYGLTRAQAAAAQATHDGKPSPNTGGVGPVTGLVLRC